MRLHKLPLLKPYQQHNQHQKQSAYIQPTDYVETPSGSGYVEETRLGANNQRQFRIEGFRRWHDERQFLNRLDFAGYDWDILSRGMI